MCRMVGGVLCRMVGGSCVGWWGVVCRMVESCVSDGGGQISD